MISLNFANTNNRCKYIASNLRPSRCLLDMIIPWKQIIDLWAAILVMMIYFLTLDVPVDMFLSIPSIAFLMSSCKIVTTKVGVCFFQKVVILSIQKKFTTERERELNP